MGKIPDNDLNQTYRIPMETREAYYRLCLIKKQAS